MTQRLIWLATPTRDGKAHARMLMSCFQLQLMAATGKSRGFSFALDVSQGSPNIPRQRNWSVAKAALAGAEAIIFIDSDIEFNPEDVLRICERPEEVIGIAHQTRPREWTDEPNMSGHYFEATQKKPFFDRSQDLLRARKLTTGFLYAKMTVFEKMRATEGLVTQFMSRNVDHRAWPYLYNYFMHEMQEVVPHPDDISKLREVGLQTDTVRVLDGEDWDFNTKCARAGVKSYIEPLATIRHYEGSLCMNLGLHDYWTQHMIEFRNEYLEWLRFRATRDPHAAKVLAAWNEFVEGLKRAAQSSIPNRAQQVRHEGNGEIVQQVGAQDTALRTRQLSPEDERAAISGN